MALARISPAGLVQVNGLQRSFRPSVNRRMTEVTPSTADHHNMPAHDADDNWSPQSGNGGVSCSL